MQHTDLFTTMLRPHNRLCEPATAVLQSAHYLSILPQKAKLTLTQAPPLNNFPKPNQKKGSGNGSS